MAVQKTNDSLQKDPPKRGEKKLDRREAAKRLECSYDTVIRLERCGALEPYSDASGKTRYMISNIDRVLYQRINKKRKPRVIAAWCFQLFERGYTLAEVVVETRATPENVRQLHRQWVDMAISAQNYRPPIGK